AKWNHGLGLSANFATLWNKIRISSEILFSSKDFAYAYNYRVLDLEDPIPIPDITTVELSYLEIPILIMYQFNAYGKLSGSLSAGFHTAFLVIKKEGSIRLGYNKPRSAIHSFRCLVIRLRVRP
ncbi:hypothetical protein MJD09_10160, partial [bacterium]|nr:hypothetical protein [bacterium]